jgi:hypothetical protein
LGLGDELLDVEVVEVREGISLVNVLFFLVNDLGVASVHYIFDEVRRVVDLCEALLVIDAAPSFLNFILGLLLNHLPALPD